MERIVQLADELKKLSETAKEITEDGKTMIDNINEANSSMVGNTAENPDTVQLSIPNFTTSKLLLWSVVIFTALLFVAIIVVDVLWNKNVSYLMPYAITITTPTIVGYNTKSYLENKQKYSNTVNLPKINIKD